MAGSNASGSSEPMPLRPASSSQKISTSSTAPKSSNSKQLSTSKRGRSTRARKKNDLGKDTLAGTSRHDLEVAMAQRIMAKDDALHYPDYGDFDADADDSDSSDDSIASPRRIASPMPQTGGHTRTFSF